MVGAGVAIALVIRQVPIANASKEAVRTLFIETPSCFIACAAKGREVK
jgi:hypothetical protein